MKHFIGYLSFVFLALFLVVLNKTEKRNIMPIDSKPNLRIFAYSSFTSQWGPGPKLKEIFERECNCTVEFIDASDSSLLLQRMKIEGEGLGADLVIGLDQFFIQKAMEEHKWRQMDLSKVDFEPTIKNSISNSFFIPYDWGVLAFVGRKSELKTPPKELEDLLISEYKNSIAIEDPRTSSPGFLFLNWVVQSKGENEGFWYLEKLMDQVHSFSSSWSMAYGLFQKKQVKLVFSYITSPIYHLIEDKSDDYIALQFKEPHPIQIEYLGIPDFCNKCELAQKFANLVLSKPGQKIIMEQNYMFPVIKGVKEGTAFDQLPSFKILNPNSEKKDISKDQLLKKWIEMRRSHSS